MIHSSSLDVPYQVQFTNGQCSAIADVPKAKGGDGQGFGPHELVEAALATCLTMTAQMYAKKHAIPLEGVSAEVHIDRSQPNEVTLVYSLKFDGPLSPGQERDMRVAASTCPVARTLSGKLACRSKEAEVCA
jgi:putative redox protein